MELSEASSPSSSSAPRKYDVFLSFRGEDTRHGITGNLYNDLRDKGLKAYMDDQELPIGKSIRPELLQAIQESKSAIVILSKNYADSTWCLDELAEIVECVETRDLILYPVFYRVDPSDVRRQKNNFDLTKYRVVTWKRALVIIFKFLIPFSIFYRVDPRDEIAKARLDSWKRALHIVGKAAGLHDKGERYEKDVRDEIVGKISEELKRTSRIGLDEEMMRNLELPITDVIFGKSFEANCEKVLECLKNNQVSRIGIYGMGGVGKTTVMKHVHNQILTDRATFCGVCWVTVSHDFSIPRLQHDIFKQLNRDFPREDTEMSRAASLYDVLKKMKGKYIVILDDVWDKIPLGDVGIPVGVNSCRLIVTARSLDVCKKMVCEQNIKISPLDWEEAWELFKKINLGRHEEFPPEVIETAKDVARMCGGLPLAIKTMAGSMWEVTDIHEWRNALDDLKKPETFMISDMGSEVVKVLKHSYDRLRYEELQQCFLSCALYPEDFLIPRDELIDYCIVKGLIRKRNSRRAEIDMGHATLNKLIRCCLLEGLFGIFVKMHDLVREMALHIIKSEKNQEVMVNDGFKLTEIPEKEWTGDLEVVSLMQGDIREIPDGWSPRCPKLSTLMLQVFYRLIHISDSFFVHMHNLQVLNLHNCQYLQKLPDSVGELINLKALWLGGCLRLQYIPSLRKLEKLEYLDLTDTQILEVPGGVGGMMSLRCLCMKCSATMEGLMELRQLEVFRGQLRNVSDYNVLVRSKWFRRLWDSSLYVTSLDEMDNHKSRYHLLNYKRDEKKVILEELSLGGRGVVDVPCDINLLIIDKCVDTGKCLLEFGEDARVREWKKIEIKGCREVEWVAAMPSSSSDVQLPSIELRVIAMENMKGIFNWWEYCDSTPSTTIPIPSRGGRGRDNYNQLSFSRLKVLRISQCAKLKVGLTVNCLVYLPMLEMLHIADCYGLEEIIGGGGRGVEDDHGYHNNNNIRNITLSNLKELFLKSLPLLRSIYDKGNIICDSIEKITLVNCRKLKRLPLTSTTNSTSSSSSRGSPQPPFPSLMFIRIEKSEEEWWESLELVDSTYHHLLRPFLW